MMPTVPFRPFDKNGQQQFSIKYKLSWQSWLSDKIFRNIQQLNWLFTYVYLRKSSNLEQVHYYLLFEAVSYNTHLFLYRWIRAALNRICLGECWLRPGVGKIRNQAQTLFPKLSQIVLQTNELQVIVETLENNLPRLLVALAEYTTDEEISGKFQGSFLL